MKEEVEAAVVLFRLLLMLFVRRGGRGERRDWVEGL